MLDISYKERLTEEVDGTIAVTTEETGHGVQVTKAVKSGSNLELSHHKTYTVSE